MSLYVKCFPDVATAEYSINEFAMLHASRRNFARAKRFWLLNPSGWYALIETRSLFSLIVWLTSSLRFPIEFGLMSMFDDVWAASWWYHYFCREYQRLIQIDEMTIVGRVYVGEMVVRAEFQLVPYLFRYNGSHHLLETTILVLWMLQHKRSN